MVLYINKKSSKWCELQMGAQLFWGILFFMWVLLESIVSLQCFFPTCLAMLEVLRD